VVAGQTAPQLVVKVIRPHGVEAPARLRLGTEHRGQVPVVFRDQQGRPPDRLAHAGLELCEEVPGPVVHQGVRGVEPEAVEVVLLQPPDRVLDEEVAHGAALWPV
jgi:hypothetical protein